MTVVRAEALTKWYGEVLGLNQFTAEFEDGITGLVGPNGAGKSTLLKLMTGQLLPDEGELSVLGERPWNNPNLMARMGYCPEHNNVYGYLTGRAFVEALLRLSGTPRAEARRRATNALRIVGMEEEMNRPLVGYSKGMRQRTKLAQALAHNPELLLLDEPLNGTDPVGRAQMIKVILELPERGTSVIISSHILFEVERLTDRVVLIHRGKALATGRVGEIRSLIDDHPHTILLQTPEPRTLAKALAAAEDVTEIGFPEPQVVQVRTRNPEEFYTRLPRLVAEEGLAVRGVESPDDNLEAVFRYLVG